MTDSKWFTGAPTGKEVNRLKPGVYYFVDAREQSVWMKNRNTRSNINWHEHAVCYEFNQYGFRGKIIPAPGQAAAFGCSFTFGDSVDEHEHWPGLIGVANCGENGASNDRIVRQAVKYIEHWGPSEIYVMMTFAGRREHADDSGALRNFNSDTAYEKKLHGVWETGCVLLSNEFSDQLNYDKNKLLLECYCQSRGVKLHLTNVWAVPQDKSWTPARDLLHPGPAWHSKIAENFIKTQ